MTGKKRKPSDEDYVPGKKRKAAAKDTSKTINKGSKLNVSKLTSSASDTASNVSVREPAKSASKDSVKSASTLPSTKDDELGDDDVLSGIGENDSALGDVSGKAEKSEREKEGQSDGKGTDDNEEKGMSAAEEKERKAEDETKEDDGKKKEEASNNRRSGRLKGKKYNFVEEEVQSSPITPLSTTEMEVEDEEEANDEENVGVRVEAMVTESDPDDSILSANIQRVQRSKTALKTDGQASGTKRKKVALIVDDTQPEGNDDDPLILWEEQLSKSRHRQPEDRQPNTSRSDTGFLEDSSVLGNSVLGWSLSVFD